MSKIISFFKSIFAWFASFFKKEQNKIGGWVQDIKDGRDHIFGRKAPVVQVGVDLRKSGFEPPIYNQGQLGSCTANGVGDLFEYALKKQKGEVFMPSRLFIYYQERVIENTVGRDCGAQIRDGMKVLNKTGTPPEAAWPYLVSKFADSPPPIVYAEAILHKSIKYERVDNSNADNIKHALSLGLPVVFGMSVYESFESAAVAKTGMVPMPKKGEKFLGGHCMVIVGYNDKAWLVRNSWGTSWGLGGYCYIPFEYLTDPTMASDFWILETVTG